jgi:CheY-like chemotaxis protein
MAEQRNKRILAVEDNPNIRRLIVYNLKRNGYEVLEAGDGKAAVRVLQKTTPDLIILDVRMPEMDGFQLLELLRRYPSAAKIPVIMLTALSQQADIDKALSLGVVDYLVKPLDPAHLLAKAASVLRRRTPDASNAQPVYDGPNRRGFARAPIRDVVMDPLPGGMGIDLGEGGVSWRTKEPPRVEDVVQIDADPFIEAVGLKAGLRARVIYVRSLGAQEFQVGAAFIGLREEDRDNIRRVVLTRQSRMGRDRTPAG